MRGRIKGAEEAVTSMQAQMQLCEREDRSDRELDKGKMG